MAATHRIVVSLDTETNELTAVLSSKAPFGPKGETALVSVALGFDPAKPCPMPTGTKKVRDSVEETDDERDARVAAILPAQFDVDPAMKSLICEALQPLIDHFAPLMAWHAEMAAARHKLGGTPEKGIVKLRFDKTAPAPVGGVTNKRV